MTILNLTLTRKNILGFSCLDNVAHAPHTRQNVLFGGRKLPHTFMGGNYSLIPLSKVLYGDVH